MDNEARRRAYAADVTYVTNSELGFDFLRENLAQGRDELVLQRGFNYCIIDEVDSILIDEARTPLIISGQAEAASGKYSRAAKLASALVRDVHYTVDEKQRNVLLTEDGCAAALSSCTAARHGPGLCAEDQQQGSLQHRSSDHALALEGGGGCATLDDGSEGEGRLSPQGSHR
jgi:preprotein translocase subunit SecA